VPPLVAHGNQAFFSDGLVKKFAEERDRTAALHGKQQPGFANHPGRMTYAALRGERVAP
jgi:hypothetical protein